jgi:hypothetical protein
MQAEPAINTILDLRFDDRGTLTQIQLLHQSKVAFLVAHRYNF